MAQIISNPKATNGPCSSTVGLRCIGNSSRHALSVGVLPWRIFSTFSYYSDSNSQIRGTCLACPQMAHQRHSGGLRRMAPSHPLPKFKLGHYPPSVVSLIHSAVLPALTAPAAKRAFRMR